MVDHSLESLFWIRKEDMLIKYSLDRIGAQIKDKDAKSICYVFFKLFPKFEIVYIIQGGRDVKKIRDFFHFLACFFYGSPERDSFSFRKYQIQNLWKPNI